MIKQGSSWSIARSALAGSSLAVAALVSVTPVQAHHESERTESAVHARHDTNVAVVATDSAKANTGKKVARDTKARGESKKSAHREAHATKSAKKSGGDEKNQKVAKVEKSKSSNDDMGGSDDPLEGL